MILVDLYKEKTKSEVPENLGKPLIIKKPKRDRQFVDPEKTTKLKLPDNCKHCRKPIDRNVFYDKQTICGPCRSLYGL